MINVSDVRYESTGGTIGRRSKATRSSRSNSITGMQVTCKHMQTGVAVKGEVPSGSYSRAALRSLVAKLHAKLLLELDEAVARKLRLPGR
jgi:hypothetical protein